jgi:hypothetical protein
MRGLVPRIHDFAAAKAWMAGPSLAKPGHDEFNLIGKCSNWATLTHSSGR